MRNGKWLTFCFKRSLPETRHMNMEISTDSDGFGNFCVRPQTSGPKETCWRVMFATQFVGHFVNSLFTCAHIVSAACIPSIRSGPVWGMAEQWNPLSSKPIAQPFSPSGSGLKNGIENDEWCYFVCIQDTGNRNVYTFVPLAFLRRLGACECVCWQSRDGRKKSRSMWEGSSQQSAIMSNEPRYINIACKHIRIIYANQRIHFTHTQAHTQLN